MSEELPLPLKKIHAKLQEEGVDVSLAQLTRWNDTDRRERVGFPKPKEVLGRYRFYDYAEVKRWVTLWRSATEGTGGRLNG